MRMRSAGSPGAKGNSSHTMIVAAKAEATAWPSRDSTFAATPFTTPPPAWRGAGSRAGSLRLAGRGLPGHEDVVRARHVVAEAVIDHGTARADRGHDRV